MSSLLGVALVGSWLAYKKMKNNVEGRIASINRRRIEEFKIQAKAAYEKEQRDKLLKYTDPAAEDEIRSKIHNKSYSGPIKEEFRKVLGEEDYALIERWGANIDFGVRLKLAHLGKIPINEVMNGYAIPFYLSNEPDILAAYNKLNIYILKILKEKIKDIDLQFVDESKLGQEPEKFVYYLDKVSFKPGITKGRYLWSERFGVVLTFNPVWWKVCHEITY